MRYGAVAALAGLGLMWTSLTLGDPRLFRGATLLNALLTGWVILGAVRADGPMNPLLGNWPLRMIGKVSYAAYLIHWPLFLFVDGTRFDLAPRPLFVVRLVLTLTLATISYWVVEYPFRRGLKGLSRPRLAGLMATSIASVAVLTLVVPVHPPQDVQFTIGGPPPDFDGDQYQFGVRQEDRVVPAPGNASQADILLVGDSVAWSISPGFAGWNEQHPDQNVTLDTHISFGCPISGPGTWLGPSGEVKTWQDCATWEPDLPRAFSRSQPDAVVIVMGLGDLGGREVDGEWRSLGDPAYDEWFRGKLTPPGRHAGVVGRPGGVAHLPRRAHPRPRRPDRRPHLARGQRPGPARGPQRHGARRRARARRVPPGRPQRLGPLVAGRRVRSATSATACTSRWAARRRRPGSSCRRPWPSSPATRCPPRPPAPGRAAGGVGLGRVL